VHYINTKPLNFTTVCDTFISMLVSAGAIKIDPECSTVSIKDFAVGRYL